MNRNRFLLELNQPEIKAFSGFTNSFLTILLQYIQKNPDQEINIAGLNFYGENNSEKNALLLQAIKNELQRRDTLQYSEHVTSQTEESEKCLD